MAYCFEDLTDFDQVLCDDFLPGGTNAIAILDPDHSITNWDDADEWNAAIAAGEAVILKSVKGEFPSGSAATIENPVACGSENILSGFDYTFSVTDANVTANNDSAWANLNGREVVLVWFECENDEIRVVNRDVRVTTPAATLPASNKEFQVYNAVFEWSTPRDWYPVRYTAPTGIFE